MRTERRILLHIGAPKCGSTYLQRVLLRNRAVLRENGVCYPKPPAPDHPGNALMVNDMVEAQIELWFENNIDTVILSHEDLLLRPVLIENFLNIIREMSIPLECFAFLRPMPEIVYGDYSQRMKQFFEIFLKSRSAYGGQNFEECAEFRTRNMRFVEGLEKWRVALDGRLVSLAHFRQIKPFVQEKLAKHIPLNWDVEARAVNHSLRIQQCQKLAFDIGTATLNEAEIRSRFEKSLEPSSRVKDPDRHSERSAWIEAILEEEIHALREAYDYDNSWAEDD